MQASREAQPGRSAGDRGPSGRPRDAHLLTFNAHARSRYALHETRVATHGLPAVTPQLTAFGAVDVGPAERPEPLAFWPKLCEACAAPSGDLRAAPDFSPAVAPPGDEAPGEVAPPPPLAPAAPLLLPIAAAPGLPLLVPAVLGVALPSEAPQ